MKNHFLYIIITLLLLSSWHLTVKSSASDSNSKTLAVGETWSFEGGWTLTAQSIDAKSSPRQVWLVLYRNGVKLEDKVVIEGDTYNYNNIFSVKVASIYAGPMSDMVLLISPSIAPIVTTTPSQSITVWKAFASWTGSSSLTTKPFYASGNVRLNYAVHGMDMFEIIVVRASDNHNVASFSAPQFTDSSILQLSSGEYYLIIDLNPPHKGGNPGNMNWEITLESPTVAQTLTATPTPKATPANDIKVIQNKGYLAVSSGKSIVIFNLTGVYVEKTIQIDQCSRCESITWDGSYFWLASFDTAEIYKVDFNGKVLALLDAPDGTQPFGLAWDGNYLWMSSYMIKGGVYKIDPKDGSVISKYAPPIVNYQGYGGLAMDSDKKILWLADAYGSGIYKLAINEHELKLIHQIPSPDTHLSGLAWGSNSVWVHGYPSYKIFKLDPVDGEVDFSFSPSPQFIGQDVQNAGLVFIKVLPQIVSETEGIKISITPSNEINPAYITITLDKQSFEKAKDLSYAWSIIDKAFAEEEKQCGKLSEIWDPQRPSTLTDAEKLGARIWLPLELIGWKLRNTLNLWAAAQMGTSQDEYVIEAFNSHCIPSVLEVSEQTTKETTPVATTAPPISTEKTFTNSIGMEFVLIPAGEFDMGSPSNEAGRDSNEGPVHRVKISKAFYLGKYEVTQKQWRDVMGTDPLYFKGDNLPVEQVLWNNVQEFVKKLNEKEGTNKYRLPSEAEWEYAARAGTTTRYSSGDDESKLGEYAWYYANSGSKPHEVGQKKSNPWGLYDMHGNVWEWVQDIYHDSYNGAPTDGNAWEGDGSNRVVRGGSWAGNARNFRSANRYGYAPGSRDITLGFRLLSDLIPTPAPTAISQSKTLAIGETWNVGGGWTLTAQAIDAKSSPRQVWLALLRNGIKLDDKVVAEGKTYTYSNVFSVKIASIYVGPTSDMVLLTDPSISS